MKFTTPSIGLALCWLIHVLPTGIRAQGTRPLTNPQQIADSTLAAKLLAEATTLDKAKNYLPARTKYLEATRLFQKVFGQQHPEYINAYRWAANTLWWTNDYDYCANEMAYILPIAEKTLGAQHRWVAMIVQVSAQCNFMMKNHDLALAGYKRALAIRLATVGEDIQTMNLYNLMAQAYSNLGDYDRALVYFQKQISLCRKLNIPTSGGDLGICYKNKGQYLEALSIYDQAIAELSNTGRTNSFAMMAALNNKLIVLKRLKRYAEGIQTAQQAIQVSEKLLVDNPTLTNEAKGVFVDCLINLGDLYNDKGDYQAGLNTFQNAKERSLQLPSAFQDLGTCDLGLAHSQMGLGHFQKADSLLQTAKTHFAYQGPLQLAGLRVAPFEAIECLKQEAYNNLMWYKQDGNPQRLKKAWAIVHDAIEMTNAYRNQLSFTDARTQMMTRSYPLFELGLSIAVLAQQQQPTLLPPFAAFTLVEQAKAMRLYESMRDARALRYSGLPEPVLAMEQQLKSKIQQTENSLAFRRGQGRNDLDSNIVQLNFAKVSLLARYDSLKQSLAKQSPAYYQLKYGQGVLSAEEARRSLLSKDQSLLSYFVGDSSITIILLNQQHYIVQQIKKDFPLGTWINDFKRAMTKEQRFQTQTYADLGYALHQKLIAPLQAYLTPDLLILPDGLLGYLPFEILLSQKPLQVNRVNTFDYLLKKHTISYGFSASLLREMATPKHPKITPTNPLIAFAPFFEGKADTVKWAELYEGERSGQTIFNALEHSGAEVLAAAQMMKGKAFLGADATKKQFLNQAPQAKILHLATHAIADDQSGDFSFLAFPLPGQPGQVDLLFARDLYSLELNTDLVVISACESGIGQLQTGEGLISLGRAFAYAGVHAMMNSLWRVPDEATKQLMIQFYKNLSKGMGKVDALRQAKLDFLKSSKNEFAHPYFWAGIVFNGQARP
jgi:CHAT domain-containing protein